MHVYTVSGDQLSEKTTFDLSEGSTAIEYSPNGENLAVTSGRNVFVHEAASYQVHTCISFLFSAFQIPTCM